MKKRKQITIKVVKDAILALREWRALNDSQGCMHLVHLLAAKYAGAQPGKRIQYSEQLVDFAFCNQFLKVNESVKPYFDPLEMNHRIDSHPHSNIATARKKTFSDKWKAGSFYEQNGKEYFELSEEYIPTLINKMSKRGSYTKLSPAALVCWLYREAKWSSTTIISDVVEKFKDDFNFQESEFDAIFLTEDSDTNFVQYDRYLTINSGENLTQNQARKVRNSHIRTTMHLRCKVR